MELLKNEPFGMNVIEEELFKVKLLVDLFKKGLFKKP